MDPQIFVINLINNNSRMKNILNELNKVNLCDNIIRINAIDAKKAYKLRHQYFTQDVEDNINNLKSTITIPTWGAAGCAISHINTWRYIYKNKINLALIFEDDTEISNTDDFNYCYNLAKNIYKNKIQNSTDNFKPFFFSFLSYTSSPIYKFENRNMFDFSSDSFFIGTSCYMVNYDFCLFMNNQLMPITNQIDVELAKYLNSNKYNYNKRDIYLFNKKSGIIQSKKFNSNVQFYFINLEELIWALYSMPKEIVKIIFGYLPRKENIQDYYYNYFYNFKYLS